MLKKMILFLWMPAVFSATHAQNKANNHWYFGAKAGINFNTSPPQKLSDNAFVAIEGSAGVSDSSGQLLFYTRGDFVYNKNHVMMPNGFGLTTGFTIAQPASIVQLPGTDNLYYIFSCNGEWLGTPHLTSNKGTYSIVDMELDGGLGAIGTKNVFITDSVMECMLVVPHSVCDKYWVIYHIAETDRFESYLFDPDGLHPSPVVSHTATMPSPHSSNASRNVATLSASPDNSMVSYVNMNDSMMYLLRFDNSTGILSDFATYKTGYPYGSCFSPDSKKLYLTSSTVGIMPSTNVIRQFDLSSGDPATIVAGNFVVESLQADISNAYGYIQRGPDGVLYIACIAEDTLATISQPNELGAACNFNAKGFDISPATSWVGLPAIAYISGTKRPDLGPDIAQCSGPVTLDPQGKPGENYTWCDGSTGPTLLVEEGGTYCVSKTVCGKTYSDTIQVTFENEQTHFSMPNVITPNGDNVNDYIDMAALLNDCAVYDLKIYNRWGHVIYDEVKENPHFTGHTKTGSKLQPGVYFYVYIQGNVKKNGTITVLY